MCMQAHGSQHGTYCHPCQLAVRNVMQATLYQSHTQLLLVKVVNLLNHCNNTESNLDNKACKEKSTYYSSKNNSKC